MAAYTVETVIITGLTPTSNAVSSSDTFANSGRVVVRVSNGSGGLLTVTAVTTQTVETDLDVEDRVVTIADSAVGYIGPFTTSLYGTTVTLNYDVTTSVFAEVITL